MKKEVGDTLIDMGVVYESKGDYDKPSKTTRSHCRSSATPATKTTGLCLNNIGSVYLGKVIPITP